MSRTVVLSATAVLGLVAACMAALVVALLMSLALMMAPAAQQEAHAKDSAPGNAPNPGQGKCIREAEKAGLIGPELNPSNTTFISGTNGDDLIREDVAADEVYCGFGGHDYVSEGGSTGHNYGVVLGGPGNDYVQYNRGTFNGGEGRDQVEGNSGTFNGGEGDDVIFENIGIFNGGEGDDGVVIQLNYPNATFNGGPGCDTVGINEGGTINLGDQSGCPA